MRGGGGAGAVLMFLLVGAMALCFESSTLACRGTLVLRDDYPNKLELSLPGLNDTTYDKFIADLRDSLGSNEKIWDLPVLRSKDSVNISQRFVLVDIITNLAGHTATLALDVTNAYLVGYRVGNDSVFTMPGDNDTRRAISHLFEGTERHTLPFTGAYNKLEQAAGASREDIALGVAALDDSVSAMIQYACDPTDPTILPTVARGLIVGIQMISEAARFRYIEFEMKSRIRKKEDSAPDGSITHMEDKWFDLSKEVQKSYSDGVLQRSIQILRPNDPGLRVSVVQTVLPYISLLHFYCKPPSSLEELRRHPAALPLIRLVTSDPTCPAHIQSTLRILGPDGLCVDVKDDSYDNGTPIQLWPCQSYNYRNQLWTFSADGTLRSNGKCLASDGGNKPGDSIIIHDCQPGVDAYTWRPFPSGTISSASGLVLSADSSEEGTTLSARDNTYATGQSWLPTNSTSPSVHQIAGISGLYCLHADGDVGVVLRVCANMEEASRWALYPDSSIRPDQTRRQCLAPPEDTRRYNRPLKIVSCDPNSPRQRWLFGNDGTIINLSTDLVMDVRGSHPGSGAQLTLNARAGTATQEWQALL